MANMYSDKSGRETPGEALAYDKFKSLLPDEYLVFHNQIMPGNTIEIDFIVVHPTFGVWVVEVKDWAIDQIRVIDSNLVELKKGKILGFERKSTVKNPLSQARDNLIYLKESFQKHRLLCHAGGAHDGKLLLPINCFVIFTNISRNDIDLKGDSDFFPATKVWTQEFLRDPYLQENEFEKALLSAREYKFQCELDSHQIVAVKRSIGVAIVKSISAPVDQAQRAEVEEETGVLDEYQNKLVRHKIESELVVEGPAGSGKSVVLLQRALFIQREKPNWRIGVICFNAVMANYLRKMLSTQFHPDVPPDTIDICVASPQSGQTA